MSIRYGYPAVVKLSLQTLWLSSPSHSRHDMCNRSGCATTSGRLAVETEGWETGKSGRSSAQSVWPRAVVRAGFYRVCNGVVGWVAGSAPSLLRGHALHVNDNYSNDDGIWLLASPQNDENCHPATRLLRRGFCDGARQTGVPQATRYSGGTDHSPHYWCERVMRTLRTTSMGNPSM